MKLCALPIRTVMFSPICAYCGKNGDYYADCGVNRAVLACTDHEHQAWADRDAKAWLGTHNSVSPKHYREDPLFKETELLSDYIAVPRSSGVIDYEGWVIRKSCFDEAALITFYQAKGEWAVPVSNLNEVIEKYILVEDLKLSLPEDKHGLVDAFDLRLKAGFYRDDINAYEAAIEKQKEMEEPTADAAAQRIEDNIVITFHPEYGYGRVFAPPLVPLTTDPATA